MLQISCYYVKQKFIRKTICRSCKKFYLFKIISRATDYRFTLGFLHKAQSRAMGNTADTLQRPNLLSTMSNMVNLSNILANGVIFSTLKLTDPHTVRGRPILKDGLCNKRIFRNGLFRELKIGKESNDLAKVSLEFIKAGIFKTGNL